MSIVGIFCCLTMKATYADFPGKNDSVDSAYNKCHRIYKDSKKLHHCITGVAGYALSRLVGDTNIQAHGWCKAAICGELGLGSACEKGCDISHYYD